MQWKCHEPYAREIPWNKCLSHSEPTSTGFASNSCSSLTLICSRLPVGCSPAPAAAAADMCLQLLFFCRLLMMTGTCCCRTEKGLALPTTRTAFASMADQVRCWGVLVCGVCSAGGCWCVQAGKNAVSMTKQKNKPACWLVKVNVIMQVKEFRQMSSKPLESSSGDLL